MLKRKPGDRRGPLAAPTASSSRPPAVKRTIRDGAWGLEGAEKGNIPVVEGQAIIEHSLLGACFVYKTCAPFQDLCDLSGYHLQNAIEERARRNRTLEIL
jgi:hypothetical protein